MAVRIYDEGEKEKSPANSRVFLTVFLQGSSSPCVIAVLVIYSAEYVASENSLLPEYQLISELGVHPVLSLKQTFRGSQYLPVSPSPNTDLLLNLLSMVFLLSVKKH